MVVCLDAGLGDGLGLKRVRELHRYAVCLQDLVYLEPEVPRRLQDCAALTVSG
jgi:hypothetical protein